MEYWVSSDETPKEESLNRLRESDIYIGIVGFFYCSQVDSETGKSVTQLEYELAKQQNIPRLVFLKDQESDVKPYFVEQDPAKIPLIGAFREQIRKERVVNTFKSPGQLAALLVIALDKHVDRLRKRQAAFDVFDQEELAELQDSLRFNPLAPTQPIKRETVRFSEKGRILILGMPGSGKTTFCLMLVQSIQPDRVIVIKSCSLLETEIEDLLRMTKGASRLVLLWDDVDRVYEFSKEDLFSTIVGRCEEMAVDVITIASCRSTRSELLKDYPSSVFWRRFEIVTLDRITEKECSAIVEQFSQIFNVIIPSGFESKVIERILKAEATPLYAVSLLRENSGKTLTDEELTNIPESVKQIWAEAAKTELTTPEILLLCVLQLLRRRGVIQFIDVVSSLYSACNNSEQFDAVASSLQGKRWLTRDKEKLWSLDSQLESIACNVTFSPEELVKIMQAGVIVDHAAPTLHAFGSKYYDENNFEGSLVCLEEATRLRPDVFQLWHMKGEVLMKLKRDSEAENALREVVRLEPNHWHAWWDLGFVLERMGKYEEAVAAIEKVLDSDEGNIGIWRIKASALHKLKRYNDSVEACEKAISLNPDDAISWLMKSAGLFEQEKFEECVAAIEQYLKLEPSDPESWFHKAQALAELDRFEESLTALDEATRLGLKTAEAWHTRAKVLLHVERCEEALRALEETLKVDPEHFGVLDDKGMALWRLGRKSEAIAALEECTAKVPEDAYGWFDRASLLAEVGQQQVAKDCAARAVSLDPQNEEFRKLLAKLSDKPADE